MLPIVVKRKLCECCDKKKEKKKKEVEGAEGREERERRCAREAMFFSPMEVDQLWLRLQREKQDRRASSLYSYEEEEVLGEDDQGEENEESENEESGEEDTSGCTLCAMLITPSGQIFVSNVGDTRAVMARNSGACCSF